MSVLLGLTTLLAGCGSNEDNAVSYDSGGGKQGRNICDFKSKTEFDDFVTGLMNAGVPYEMKHYDNLPCEQK